VLTLTRNSLRLALIAGMLTGAALSTKYSAVWLVPILLSMALTYPGLRDRWRSRAKMSIAAALVAFVVIWGTFAFSIGPVMPGGLAVPAPQYWGALGKVATRVESSTPAFMLGQISPAGFPWYYPFVFLVKTPLPTLILLVAGAASLIVRRKREDIAAWFPLLLFMLAAMISGLNLGYRLILPVLPSPDDRRAGKHGALTGIIKPRGAAPGGPPQCRHGQTAESPKILRGSVSPW
jgi:4-amino-4-deoxy-L-arabinose transferase-like glycosyltransferase